MVSMDRFNYISFPNDLTKDMHLATQSASKRSSHKYALVISIRPLPKHYHFSHLNRAENLMVIQYNGSNLKKTLYFSTSKPLPQASSGRSYSRTCPYIRPTAVGCRVRFVDSGPSGCFSAPPPSNRSHTTASVGRRSSRLRPG